MVFLFLHWRIQHQACKDRFYLSLSAWNMNASIQPLEFPKYAWALLLCLDDVVMSLGSASLPWLSLISTSLLWSFSYLLVCNFLFGLLTSGEFAHFLTSSLCLGRFYELLLLTSSLWPQGVFMSCSENFCEWNCVEEGGIYRAGQSLWCWHLFTCIWWLRCLCTRTTSLCWILAQIHSFNESVNHGWILYYLPNQLDQYLFLVTKFILFETMYISVC
jgi:hypothetical protein